MQIHGVFGAVDALWREITEAGARVPERTRSVGREYGVRDFTIIDPDGSSPFFGHLHQRNKTNRALRIATSNGATRRVTRSGAQIEACYTAIASRHQECSRSAGGQHLECRPGGGGGEGGAPVGAGTIQRLSQGFGQGLGNNVAG